MIPFDLSNRRIWVAGHHGMVGSAVVRRLASENVETLTVGRKHVDLRRQADVEGWMAKNRPDVVVVAAATVGGILANSTRPAEFIYDNLMIEANIIQAAHQIGVARLLFLGSTCIYPRLANQPMAEDELLTGPLEPTNQWYAIAKIAGIKLCQAFRSQYDCDFISAMPTNLYGPEDNFDLNSSHVIPALMRKMHDAKSRGDDGVEVWGTGNPTREFLHVDDLADALVFLLKNYDDAEHINIGTGEEISIADLARLIARVVGFEGRIDFATDKPDGTPRKVSDVQRLKDNGWQATTPLEDGLRSAYNWYLANHESSYAAD
jgi:GDP-L-fucose synthase